MPLDGLRSPIPESATWYRLAVAEGFDFSRPGLYEWRIEGVGVYVGQFTHSRRPLREYALNVAKIFARRPYRRGNPVGFRRIHWALALAAKCQVPIVLTLLENHDDKVSRNQAERRLIEERRRNAATGGLAVLNAI